MMYVDRTMQYQPVRLTQVQQIQSILKLSNQMMDAARARNWEALEHMESERQELLADIFSMPIADNEIQDVSQGIQQVLELNQQIMAMGRGGRQEIAAEINRFNLGRRAKQAYGKNTR